MPGYFRNPSRTLPLEVRIAERRVIRERRRAAFGRASDEPRPVFGVCLSGGGVRSATFCYGALKALVERDLIRHVDYLSTVSGGGYIGAAVSALFASVKAPEALRSFTPPFNREGHKYLREHGNVQLPRTGPLSRDTLRLIGASVFGASWSLVFFALAFLLLACLYLMVLGELAGHELLARPGAFLRSLAYGVVEDPLFLLEATVSGFVLQFVIQVSISLLTVRAAAIAAAAREKACEHLEDEAMDLKTKNAARRRLLRDADAQELGYERNALFAIGLCVLVAFFVLVFAAGALGLPLDLAARELSGVWAPAAFFFGALVAAFVVVSSWARRGLGLAASDDGASASGQAWIGRSLIAASLGLAIYLFVGSLLLVGLTGLLLALKASGLHWEMWTGALATASLVVGRLLASEAVITQLPSFMKGPLLAGAQVLAILAMGGLGTLTFALTLASVPVPPGYVFLVGASVFCVLGVLVNLNRVSLHGPYRDRLADVYLSGPEGDFRALKLADLASGERPSVAPLHVVNCAINLAGSSDLGMRDRKSDHFSFSPVFTGSTKTGYVRTADYRNGETLLSSAMAISGAAAGAQMGVYGTRLAAFLLASFNIRTGAWWLSPRSYRSERSFVDVRRYLEEGTPAALLRGEETRLLGQERSTPVRSFPPSPASRAEGLRFWPWYLGLEAFAKTTADTALVNLSDGGHTGDNLGLYAMLQRRCRVIIAIDAGHDPDLRCQDLLTALQQAELDESVRVDIDLRALRPLTPGADGERGKSRMQYAIGRIHYPERRIDLDGVDDPLGFALDDPCLQDPSAEDGSQDFACLLYVKACLTGHEPEAIRSWSYAEPEFPHRSTADQFFSEAQFEAYRALGHHVVRTLLADVEEAADTDAMTLDARTLMEFCIHELVQSEDDSEALGALGLSVPEANRRS